MSLSVQVLAFAAVLAASLLGTGIVLKVLNRHAILDRPNERSAHSRPVPRGGGIAVILVIIVAWLAIALAGHESRPDALWPVAILLGATLVLSALSWADDIQGLSPVIRLLGQAVAVGVVLALAPAEGPYFQGIFPPAIDRIAAGLVWIWFINLFNFMDGIDGISGVEAASLGVGVAAVAAVSGLGAPVSLYGLTGAAAALGFLRWNWHPAKIFLGDVGSTGLGFVLGWLLLTLAAAGAWAAALILPLYYLADATITLLKRLARRERVWQAHSQHFYQKAVRSGKTHAEVALSVLLADAVLVGLAVAAANGYVWSSLAGACAVVGGLLLYFNALPAAEPTAR
ncbi:MAG: glycosyltransferase family 4 protein [Rhodospirillales bacterium]|nr:glycosyltransferase family 4 protein [Rhodospirillales bacterium]